jgi:hypothetical protein
MRHLRSWGLKRERKRVYFLFIQVEEYTAERMPEDTKKTEKKRRNIEKKEYNLTHMHI